MRTEDAAPIHILMENGKKVDKWVSATDYAASLNDYQRGYQAGWSDAQTAQERIDAQELARPINFWDDLDHERD